jgi:drug/metabolite transporter (DMT)-like permease
MGIAAGVVGAAAVGLEHGRHVVWNAASIVSLLYLAIFGSAVTFGLYYWLLAHHSATRLSMIAYGTPVVAVLVGAMFMNEPLTARIVIGTVLVVGGVGMVMGFRGAGKTQGPE